VMQRLNMWTSTGVNLRIPGRASLTVVVPRLCLLLADIMEHRMMLGTHGSYDTRCMTKVFERRNATVVEDADADARAPPDCEDIPLDLKDISDGTETPQDEVRARACVFRILAHIAVFRCRSADGGSIKHALTYAQGFLRYRKLGMLGGSGKRERNGKSMASSRLFRTFWSHRCTHRFWGSYRFVRMLGRTCYM
jgi:hypothetical protein